MAWIEVHQSLVSHKKTLAVCDALAIEPAHAVGHLVCLWTWSIDNAPHGDLSEVKPATIARAAGWPVRRTQDLLDALVVAGFLERTGQRLQIHDYDDYIGKLQARREANVIRNRAARARQVIRSQEEGASQTEPGPSRHVTRSKGVGDGATQPDTTGHNTTGQYPNPPPPSEPSEGGCSLSETMTTAACCTKGVVTNGRQHLASCRSRVKARPVEA